MRVDALRAKKTLVKLQRTISEALLTFDALEKLPMAAAAEDSAPSNPATGKVISQLAGVKDPRDARVIVAVS